MLKVELGPPEGFPPGAKRVASLLAPPLTPVTLIVYAVLPFPVTLDTALWNADI